MSEIRDALQHLFLVYLYLLRFSVIYIFNLSIAVL